MLNMKTVLGLAGILGLAACDTPQRGGDMFALVDNTGRVVAYAPASAVRNTPPGTAIRISTGGGSDQVVTLGPRVGEATSAGVPVVMSNDDGRPVITRVGGGQGDLAPAGVPVVTGTGADGRPIIEYRDPAAAQPQPRPRTPRRRISPAAATPAPPVQ